MPKLVPLHQTMEVEKLIVERKVGGVVTKSNFLEENKRHLFPVHDEVLSQLNEGDKLRITFYANEDEIHQDDKRMAFKTKGIRYERWNEENEGWDIICEEFPPSPDTPKG